MTTDIIKHTGIESSTQIVRAASDTAIVPTSKNGTITREAVNNTRRQLLAQRPNIAQALRAIDPKTNRSTYSNEWEAIRYLANHADQLEAIADTFKVTCEKLNISERAEALGFSVQEKEGFENGHRIRALGISNGESTRFVYKDRKMLYDRFDINPIMYEEANQFADRVYHNLHQIGVLTHKVHLDRKMTSGEVDTLNYLTATLARINPVLERAQQKYESQKHDAPDSEQMVEIKLAMNYIDAFKGPLEIAVKGVVKHQQGHVDRLVDVSVDPRKKEIRAQRYQSGLQMLSESKEQVEFSDTHEARLKRRKSLPVLDGQESSR